MKSKFIIGIDLGATNIKIGLVDSNNRIISRKRLSTKSLPKRNQLLKKVNEIISNVLQDNRLQRKDIVGIGVGLPGPVDFRKGLVHFLPNIPGWENFPIRRRFSSVTKLPVFVDNDVNLISLAEQRLGAGKKSHNMICMTLGTGVGGAVIIEENLYRGSSFAAGEIGHIPITENGPICNCGGRGCLESFVGNKNILKKAKAQLKNHKITLEKLTLLARAGNVKAINLWREVGQHVGIALVGVINLLNPDKVVIGGGVSQAGEILFDEIRKTVRLRAMPTQARAVKIVKAKLGDDAGILGAAILVKENML
ncbi:MAG: ROK family protein [Candidatus Omnitrophica bacterium]|nr:ROK family protein [Candidatus Omnitrophota bacterium]